MDVMDVLKIILTIFQIVVSFGSICVMIYALKKFLNRPRTTMEDEIAQLKGKIEEIERSLIFGNDKFRAQDRLNKVMLHSILALIEFEMQYCLTEHREMSDGLKTAKKKLDEFLSDIK